MSLLLDALKQKNQARPPIWMMRQAGRYLPEYRAYKKGRPLLELFRNPQAIVDITLMPIELIGFDAAILFSDILTVLEGLGQEYHFEEGKGPLIHKPLTKASQLLQVSDCYAHIDTAIRTLKKNLDKPLLGFAGAPFTVATYLIGGVEKAKKLYFQEPDEFALILDKIADATITYLTLQIEAGVDAIQLFDSWANVLSLHDFRECSLTPLRKIATALPEVPLIVFSRGSSFFAKELATLPIACISVDFGGEMGQVRKEVPDKALQGNLDPMALYGSYQQIERACSRILDAMEGDPGFIFNLGHGVLPDTEVEKVKFMVEYVTNISRAPCPAA